MAAVAAAHDGLVGSASPTYRQCTRSRLLICGTGWNVTGPVPAVSRSLSGSVVQYRYQVRECVPRPRSTFGSAQLSTVPPPGMRGFSALWYLPGGAAAVAVVAAYAGNKAARTTRTDTQVTYLTTRVIG